MIADLGAFLAVSVLVIVTPGQDTALTIRNTLAGGRRAGVFTAVGVVAGQAMWIVASTVGLTALLIASQPAFTALRWAGAVYLTWLGVRSLHRAWRGEPMDTGAPPLELAGPSPDAALRQGTLSALGNPKLAMFFVSLFPQFVAPDRASWLTALALGAAFCAMTLAWLSGYAAVIAKAGPLLSQSWPRRALDAILGATFVALGIRVAAERH